MQATSDIDSGWLRDRTGLDAGSADSLAAVTLGALFSTRLLRLVLGHDPLPVSDEAFIATWVEMVHGALAGSESPSTAH